MEQCHCSVRIKNLGVRRGSQIILSNISFTVNHGEILALIGRNGAGKTTLLKSIIKSLEHTGEIEFFNSKGQRILNPKIGYVPQRLSFDRNTPLTVLDMFCTNSSNMPIWIGHSKKRIDKCREILGKVGAEKHIDKSIGKLSGGELQRVLLAFALDPMPDILLLDEPVSALDRNGISAFYGLVTSLRSEYHMPIILVSHDLAHIHQYATSYVLIDNIVIEAGKVSDMMKSKKICETFGLEIGGENKWS